MNKKDKSLKEELAKCQDEVTRLNAAYEAEKKANHSTQSQVEDAKNRAEQSELESTSTRVRLGLIREELDIIIKTFGIHVDESSRLRQETVLRKHLEDDHIISAIVSLQEILKNNDRQIGLIRKLTNDVTSLTEGLSQAHIQKSSLEETIQTFFNEKKELQDRLAFVEIPLHSLMGKQQLISETTISQNNAIEVMVDSWREKLAELAIIEEEMTSNMKLDKVVNIAEESKKKIVDVLNSCEVKEETYE